MKFEELYKAGEVKRFHTCSLPAQTIADHSWGVAMILLRIYPKGYEGISPLKVVTAGLYHDLPEAYTGDWPATFKWEHKQLNRTLSDIENRWLMEREIWVELSQAEKRLLHFADVFELCLYCLRCRDQGYKEAETILERAVGYIKDKGWPSAEAHALFSEYFPGSEYKEST